MLLGDWLQTIPNLASFTCKFIRSQFQFSIYSCTCVAGLSAISLSQYKTNMQKSIVFLYTSNEKFENEMKTVSIYSSINVKILRGKLNIINKRFIKQ